MAKLITEVGPFKIYRVAAKVLAVYENDEFRNNIRPRDPGFGDPKGHFERILAGRVEADEDKLLQRAAFRRALAEARAKRAAQIARQGAFQF